MVGVIISMVIAVIGIAMVGVFVPLGALLFLTGLVGMAITA